MSLSERLATVTGGGSGIGKFACYALAEEGATVAVADANLDIAGQVAGYLPGEDNVRSICGDQPKKTTKVAFVTLNIGRSIPDNSNIFL